MPHICQRPSHKINGFQNQTYFLLYGEVTSPSPLSIICDYLRSPRHDAKGDDELKIYIVMKHRKKTKMTNQAS